MNEATVEWLWRSLEPAKCQPDENYPYGKAADISDGKKACSVDLPYPAPGVGTWVIRCASCGYSLGVTAAGRADDPTKITFPCKSKESA